MRAGALAFVLFCGTAGLACDSEVGSDLPAQPVPDASLDDGKGDSPDADAGPDPTATDTDGDGLDDALEDELAAEFAPVVRFHSEEQNFLSSIDWYLARVELKFGHGACSDHLVAGVGALTQANLPGQTHPQSNALCQHGQDLAYANQNDRGFFLEAKDKETVRPGQAEADWKLYVHVRSSTVVEGAYELQYWFFYPYNLTPLDGVAHEGDWEHVDITVNADHKLHSAVFTKHGISGSVEPKDLIVVDDTHVVVYPAVGTHGNYTAAGSFVATGFTDHTDDLGIEWKSASGLINVGEKDHPRDGQDFLRFGGRWGRLGVTDLTSGPTGPAFKDAW